MNHGSYTYACKQFPPKSQAQFNAVINQIDKDEDVGFEPTTSAMLKSYQIQESL
jgi:hypothetical protein